eukprot:67506-Chlamydomonas_euryale.AAC.13
MEGNRRKAGRGRPQLAFGGTQRAPRHGRHEKEGWAMVAHGSLMLTAPRRPAPGQACSASWPRTAYRPTAPPLQARRASARADGARPRGRLTRRQRRGPRPTPTPPRPCSASVGVRAAQELRQ